MAKATGPKADATDAPLSVDYDGTVYTVPAPINWDIDVLDELEAGRFTRALRLVLGTDQYDAFKAEKPRKLADAVNLWEAISQAAGTGSAGN